MVKPQQPELRRSDLGATSDDATKARLTAPQTPDTDRARGPVPEGNRPGHHPAEDQDKPSGRDFVAKTHALAQEETYEPPSDEDEVLEIRQAMPPEERAQADQLGGGDAADRIAALATKPLSLAGTLLRRMRDRL